MTLSLLNSWLEKIMPFSPRGTSYPRSREGSMPPGLPPRVGLRWKPETHRWIRPEEEEVRTERAQPKFQEISNYVNTGGFTEITEKSESILLDLFPDMLNPEQITRIKEVDSIQEKEQRPKYKRKGMTYKDFTDIVGGRVNFSNVNQVNDAVKLLHDKQEELGFKIIEDENHINKPLDGYYRRYHMLLEMDTDDGKTVTMELQLGTANQTKIADWSHDLLHKKGADRPILTSSDRRTALKYIRQMAELYAYHDGVEGAKNIYPADCVEVVKKFAGCLEVPES